LREFSQSLQTTAPTVGSLSFFNHACCLGMLMYAMFRSQVMYLCALYDYQCIISCAIRVDNGPPVIHIDQCCLCHTYLHIDESIQCGGSRWLCIRITISICMQAVWC
jgi:hypothetical protein